MSLRTKMVLSIFVFLVIVFGLLTLNLLLDAQARATAEADRSAELIRSVVGDWSGRGPAQFRPGTRMPGRSCPRKLALSELISGWTIVGRKEGGLQVMISSERDAQQVLARNGDKLRKAMDEVIVEEGGRRLFIPIQTSQGRAVCRPPRRARRGPGRGSRSPARSRAS
jgi:hypothetical protein